MSEYADPYKGVMRKADLRKKYQIKPEIVPEILPEGHPHKGVMRKKDGYKLG